MRRFRVGAYCARALLEHSIYGPELLDADGNIDFYGKPLVRAVVAEQVALLSPGTPFQP